MIINPAQGTQPLIPTDDLVNVHLIFIVHFFEAAAAGYVGRPHGADPFFQVHMGQFGLADQVEEIFVAGAKAGLSDPVVPYG